MSGISLLSSFARLSLRPQFQQNVRLISTYKPMLMKLTPCLCAEPLKKKKRVDPSLIKAREDRKKRKMEKQIRRLQKHAKQLKPIDDLEIPLVLIEEKQKRTRKPTVLSEQVIEQRALMEKEWSRSLILERIADIKNIDRIIASQERALDELWEVSETLYYEAIKPDENLMIYSGKGTLATPPIKNYDSPDGDYIDVTKKWEN